LQGKTAVLGHRCSVQDVDAKHYLLNAFNLRLVNQLNLGSFLTKYTLGLISDKLQLPEPKQGATKLFNRTMQEWKKFTAVAFKFQTSIFYKYIDPLLLKHCHWKARKLHQDDSLQAKFQLKYLNLGNIRKN